MEHIKVITPRAYKDVKADIEKLGRLDELRQFIRSNDVESLRAGAKRIAGEDGLAIHYIALHGDLLALKGEKRELITYYIGNIVSATDMTNIDPAAGLYAPLRVVVYANKEGGTWPSARLGSAKSRISAGSKATLHDVRARRANDHLRREGGADGKRLGRQAKTCRPGRSRRD
ncbi:DUF302 domain-containing protein [Xanthobacter sp. VNH20]|uniref:DUF302 domain-containing protein n=1 Tax=Xanthobacter sp. VNH20 TaxID=3156616 RepID=UPI0032B3E34C